MTAAVRIKITVVLLLAFLITTRVQPARAGTFPSSTLLVPRGAHEISRTDGQTVIWLEQYNEIQGMNLQDRRVFSIVKHDLIIKPVFEHGVVVWLELPDVGCSFCTVTIRGKELATGSEFTIGSATVKGAYPDVAISGEEVVWVDYTPTGYRLMMRKLHTQEPPVQLLERSPDSTHTYDRVELKVTGDRLVWLEEVDPGPGERLRARMLTRSILGGTPTVLLEEIRGSSEGTFDARGDTVAYLRGETLNTLTLLNLRTGLKRDIVTDGAFWPVTDGRYVFWLQYLQNGNPPNAVYGYDTGTGATFLVHDAGRDSMAGLDLNHDVLTWTSGVEVRPFSAEIHAARVTDVLPTARREPPRSAGPNLTYFPETGHNLSYGFKGFWERDGGLPVFGYPLTEEFDEHNADTGKTYVVQYFERQRYEYHPEYGNSPYEVLLGRLGAEALARSGRDWQNLPRVSPTTAHYFPATGHAIAPQFWDYWRSHGLEFGDAGVSERESLALFGYPLTEPQMETNSSGDTVLTQWFERARFEYHPGNPAGSRVLLGRLAADVLTARGW